MLVFLFIVLVVSIIAYSYKINDNKEEFIGNIRQNNVLNMDDGNNHKINDWRNERRRSDRLDKVNGV